MVHLRIAVPAERCEKVLHLLEAAPSVSNLIFLAGAARQPRGDVVLCDVAREEAGVLSEDLKELGVARDSSIALEQIDSQIGSPILTVGAMTAIVLAGVATLCLQRRLFERSRRRHLRDGTRAVAGLSTTPSGLVQR